MVGYTRRSTDDVKQPNSIEAQRAAIERWAASHGATVSAWFSDDASGATRLESRPGLTAALAHVRAHTEIGGVVVAVWDRWSRDLLGGLLARQSFEDLGVEVKSACGQGNGTDTAATTLRDMMAVFAAAERRRIGERTKAALGIRKAQGLRMGNLPFGYRDDGTGKVTPDEREQGIIARAHELRREGLTIAAIVQALGPVSRKGTYLAPDSVHAIVRDTPKGERKQSA